MAGLAVILESNEVTPPRNFDRDKQDPMMAWVSLIVGAVTADRAKLRFDGGLPLMPRSITRRSELAKRHDRQATLFGSSAIVGSCRLAQRHKAIRWAKPRCAMPSSPGATSMTSQ